ncbi:APG12-domain-containing protein [Aaosphaeria arxii CBS 175.79]|uniref:Ubiquitin-like protein ATG12 n=1 Tax=Aaosphaeria arxii CBS 175.79 TaxID=1450172 RepID=A0A6A5Y676_9PLEO|nr:APG12-domain-containing protein [Aaosphaeria arxii CBS 175.79]KAF2020796.1 APG12-domain-containing protein [Aaosphaeria arxii CBS 175.79]
MSDSPKDRIPDEDGEAAEAPLTMAASVILTNLPRDASKALESAGDLGVTKVKIRLHPIGSAPHLKQRVFNLSANQRFETIVKFLRRRLEAKDHESVYCYIGSVFSPALDEGVGNLWNCFKTNDELVVGYALSPAFG